MKNPRRTAGRPSRRHGIPGQASPRPFDAFRAGIGLAVRAVGRLAAPIARPVAAWLFVLSRLAPARRPALAPITLDAASARNRRSRKTWRR